MGFLPADYSAQSNTGKYLKLQEGKNKFRIISEPLPGYEMWELNRDGEKRPVRSKLISDLKEMVPSMNVSEFEANKEKGLYYPKAFVAIAIWNYDAKRVQILNITQKGIMEALDSLANNEDWGDTKQYDITINRTGKGMETKYEVMPSPNKGKLPADVLAEIKKTPIDLKLLLENRDPYMVEITKSEQEVMEDLDEKHSEKLDEAINPDDLPF